MKFTSVILSPEAEEVYKYLNSLAPTSKHQKHDVPPHFEKCGLLQALVLWMLKIQTPH